MMSWPFFRTSWIAGASALRFARRPPFRRARRRSSRPRQALVIVVVIVVVIVHFFVDRRDRTRAGTRSSPCRCRRTRPECREGPLRLGQGRCHRPFACVRSVDQQLNELVVLENGDPRLSRVRVDQDFSFHQGPRPAAIHATRRCARGGAVGEAVRAWPLRAVARRTRYRWRTSSGPGSSTPTPAGPTPCSSVRAPGD